MALALILSSFVAASGIGGGAQQYVLAAHRIDPVLAPTVLLGRNPAQGATGDEYEPAVRHAKTMPVLAGGVRRISTCSCPA